MEWKQNTLDLLYKPKFLNEIPNYGSQCSVILLALTPPHGPFPATYISNYVCLLVYQRILFNYNILEPSKKCFIVEADPIFNRISDITYLPMSKKFRNGRVFDSPFPVEPGMVILELSNNFFLYIRLKYIFG